jgi:hypothetical protein
MVTRRQKYKQTGRHGEANSNVLKLFIASAPNTGELDTTMALCKCPLFLARVTRIMLNACSKCSSYNLKSDLSLKNNKCCIKNIVPIEGDTLVVRYFNSVLFNKHYNTAI